MRLAALLLALGLTVMLLPLLAAGGEGGYRTPILVTENSGNDLYNHTLHIVLNESWDGWAYASDNGSDVYFLDQQGYNIYYWVEEWNKTSQHASIWVKVPHIPASGSTTIYMYYGSANPAPGYNERDKVFIIYDDFDELRGTWVKYGGGTTSLSGGKIKVTAANNGGWTYLNYTEPIRLDVGLLVEVYGLNLYADYGGQGSIWLGITQGEPSGASKTTDAFGNTPRAGLGEGVCADWGIAPETGDGSGSAYASCLTSSHGTSGWNLRFKLVASSSLVLEYWGAASGSRSIPSYVPGSGSYFLIFGATDISSSWDPPGIEIDKLVVRPYAEPEPTYILQASEPVGGGGGNDPGGGSTTSDPVVLPPPPSLGLSIPNPMNVSGVAVWWQSHTFNLFNSLLSLAVLGSVYLKTRSLSATGVAGVALLAVLGLGWIGTVVALILAALILAAWRRSAD